LQRCPGLWCFGWPQHPFLIGVFPSFPVPLNHFWAHCFLIFMSHIHLLHLTFIFGFDPIFLAAEMLLIFFSGKTFSSDWFSYFSCGKHISTKFVFFPVAFFSPLGR